MASNFYKPDKDAGWGLIFRLNDLWVQADRRAVLGDYDGWEIVLDRIFSNLLYRNEMEVVYEDEEETKPIDIKPSPKDIACWKIMKTKIKTARTERSQNAMSKNIKAYNKSQENLYFAIMEYDWWLRKFMQQHQLYLKEIESNPSKALFGGAFKKN